MNQKHHGFTLIELLTVITIVVIIAAIAVPNLLSARVSTNESSAIATMKSIVNAQNQCTNRIFIDLDADGSGEFGFFTEMAGAIPPRNLAGVELLPPLLAGAFRSVTNGWLTHSGYTFMIYLPDAAGVGLAETAGNYANVDASNAESFWCCYAWPTDGGTTGRRAFFVNQRGEILMSDNTVQGYSGSVTLPAPDAAFPAASAGRISGTLTPGQAASDGGVWVNLD